MLVTQNQYSMVGVPVFRFGDVVRTGQHGENDQWRDRDDKKMIEKIG